MTKQERLFAPQATVMFPKPFYIEPRCSIQMADATVDYSSLSKQENEWFNKFARYSFPSMINLNNHR